MLLNQAKQVVPETEAKKMTDAELAQCRELKVPSKPYPRGFFNIETRARFVS